MCETCLAVTGCHGHINALISAILAKFLFLLYQSFNHGLPAIIMLLVHSSLPDKLKTVAWGVLSSKRSNPRTLATIDLDVTFDT